MERVIKVSLMVMMTVGILQAGKFHGESEKTNIIPVTVTQSEVLEAGLKAAQKAGFKGHKLIGSKIIMTKEQEQAAACAMENISYPGNRQKILKKEKAMHFAEACFGKANTISQATQCVKKVEEKGGCGKCLEIIDKPFHYLRCITMPPSEKENYNN